MKKTTTIILISVLTLAFCCSLLVGATYAIFDAQETSVIEATTGTLDVTVTLTLAEMWYPDGQGGHERGWHIKDPSKPENENPSIEQSGNILGLKQMTQGCLVDFVISVANSGSLIAKWYVVLTCEDEFFEHITVSVKQDDLGLTKNVDENGKIFYVCEWNSIGPNKYGRDAMNFDITFDFPLPDGLQDSERDFLYATVTAEIVAVHGNTPDEKLPDKPTDAGKTNSFATKYQQPIACETRKFGI